MKYSMVCVSEKQYNNRLYSFKKWNSATKLLSDSDKSLFDYQVNKELLKNKG